MSRVTARELLKLNRTYAEDVEVAKVGIHLTTKEALDAAKSRGRSTLSFSNYAIACHFLTGRGKTNSRIRGYLVAGTVF